MKVHTIRMTEDEHINFVEFCKKFGYSQTGLIKSLLKDKMNE